LNLQQWELFVFTTSRRQPSAGFAAAFFGLALLLGANAAAAEAPGNPLIQAILPVKLFYECKAEIVAKIDELSKKPAPPAQPAQPDAAGQPAPPARAAPAAAAAAAAPPPLRNPCILQQALNEYRDKPALIGAGDVVIAVAGDSWQEPAPGSKLYVWLNGAEVSNDVTVAGAERLGNIVFLTLRLNPGKQSRAFWATLIHDAGMTARVPLSVALSWALTPPVGTPLLIPFAPTVAVTVEKRLWIAFVLIAVFGLGAIVLAIRRGVLRDKALDPAGTLLEQADQLRRLWTRRHASMDPCIKAYYPNYKPNVPGTDGYLPCLPDNVDPVCLDAADKVLRTQVAPTNAEPVIVGIIQGRRSWSYSLAATQLFAWFLFALLAGIFVWTVYGQLPAIEGSVLGLLGISVGTAGLSWAVDASAMHRSGGPSSGFFSDLISDPDNNARIHRFQCVFVNGALLLVGIANVVFDVTYPTFDQSWLIFLAISGITYTGGKQLKET
jgi:hypothetical protein